MTIAISVIKAIVLLLLYGCVSVCVGVCVLCVCVCVVCVCCVCVLCVEPAPSERVLVVHIRT